MYFFSKPKKIDLQLIDVGSPGSQTVGSITLYVDDLPDSWETTKTFEYQGLWQVLDANPMLKHECVTRGSVDLLVRRPVADGEATVYSSPTIAGALWPTAAGSTKVGVKRIQILPEDWRQVELFSVSFRDEADQHLSEIRDVIEHYSGEYGYSKRYIRTGFDAPIAPETRFSLSDLIAVVSGENDNVDSIAYFGVPGLVDGGFSFLTPSLTQFYGAQSDGAVKALGILAIGSHPYDCPEVQAFADFALDNGLALVDWSAAIRYEPDQDEFFQFFDSAEYNDDTAPI